jgi:subfamily B ATP-binding cassette protein MsbA
MPRLRRMLMNEFRKLFPFIRPYSVGLVISFFLLFATGILEIMTTALAMPLFDKILARPGITRTVSDAGGRAEAAESAAAGEAEAARKYFLALYLKGIDLLPGNDLTRVSLALLFFTFLKGACLYYSNYRMSYVGHGVVTDLRNQLYRHVLSQSMGFFALNSTGKLMSRMNSDVEQVQEAVSTSISDLFRESIQLVALIGLIIYIDWKLALLSLLIAPAAVLLTMFMGRRIRQASLHSREGIASLSDLLQQSLTGMRILKAFGMEAHEQGRFEKVAGRLFTVNLRAARILFLNSPAMEMLGVACFIPLLFYANERISVSHTLTLGFFGTQVFSLFRMYDPIRKLSRLHVGFQRAFASASRISELFETHVEIHDKPDARTLDGIRESIEFRDVSFDYQGRKGQKPVLKNIHLQVARDRVIAFVGSSGSGKTTLVSLIPRFYDVTSGSVRIDGVDVREYTQISLRRNIAIVTQDTFLFNDTIRNNIAYGDIEASPERIAAAARAALAHDFIMQLPKNYETRIGERGQRLSGGERQRISIARAILRNAPILILDEATSSLDSESEQLVQRALANLMQGRTTLIIAHRLSTIRNADRIVVLDKGRIVEIGTHDSLLGSNGIYSRFHRLQTEEASRRDDSGDPRSRP